jgi:hypothetical protein
LRRSAVPRGLDVMKRPVNIVPMYDERQKKWVETICPSINETHRIFLPGGKLPN